MKSFVVHKEIVVDAPTAEVWDALTNPKKTRHYFYHCEVLSDWKEGSPIRFKGKLFWIIPVQLNGTIKKIIPGQLLQYTIQNHGDSSVSLVTDELVPENGKTRLIITDDVGSGPGAEKRVEKSQKGWDKILHGLKKFVETKS